MSLSTSLTFHLSLNADPPGLEMYVNMGKGSLGLTQWRTVRGSSKNEASNQVLEAAIKTSGLLGEGTGRGKHIQELIEASLGF